MVENNNFKLSSCMRQIWCKSKIWKHVIFNFSRLTLNAALIREEESQKLAVLFEYATFKAQATTLKKPVKRKCK